MKKEFIELYFQLQQAHTTKQKSDRYKVFSLHIVISTGMNPMTSVYLASSSLLRKITKDQNYEDYISYIINNEKFTSKKDEAVDKESMKKILKLMTDKIRTGF